MFEYALFYRLLLNYIGYYRLDFVEKGSLTLQQFIKVINCASDSAVVLQQRYQFFVVDCGSFKLIVAKV